MTSKWKWISSKLKDILDYDPYNLSEKALEIDRALESIYGYTATPYFKEKEEEIEEMYNKMNNRKNKLKYIDGVVRSVLYCVACYEHKRNCSSCEFELLKFIKTFYKVPKTIYTIKDIGGKKWHKKPS